MPYIWVDLSHSMNEGGAETTPLADFVQQWIGFQQASVPAQAIMLGKTNKRGKNSPRQLLALNRVLLGLGGQAIKSFISASFLIVAAR